jgi:hypothetical protein
VTLTRDPLSEWFDAGARRHLDRAYAAPGQWVTTRLQDPTPAHRCAAAAMLPPINVDGPDPAGGKAVTRWGRAYLRALYYQHRWWSKGGGPGWRATRRTTKRISGALLVEFGPRRRALGIIPAGLEVRIQLAPGGQAKAKAVAELPRAERWNIAKHPGPATGDLREREWQAPPRKT